jgi:energy-converting hydrogenase Eha subunit E
VAQLLVFQQAFSIVIGCCCGASGRINHPNALDAVVLLLNLTLSQVTG